MGFGKCKKCPTAAREQKLYGAYEDAPDGYCLTHHKDASVSVDMVAKVTAASKAAAVKKPLGTWFNDQRKQQPKCCENCKKPIDVDVMPTWKAAICHIVPKNNIKSVQTHSLNRWFGCWQCHSDFDSSQAKASQMAVAKICKERFKEFEPMISDKERRHIPEWLLN